MPRSKNAVASRARRKKILKLAKGYFGSRKNVYTVAKNSVEKALTYAYVGRKLRKRDFRTLWIARINASTVCRIPNSWVNSTRVALSSTARCSLISP